MKTIKSVIIVLLISITCFHNNTHAQTCTSCGSGTTTVAAGATVSTNITIANGESKCLVGPTTGTGTYSGTITFAGTWPPTNSYLCISGNLNITGNIIANANTAQSKPNITFATNANITHSGYMLIFPGNANAASINNYGIYTNTFNSTYSAPSTAIVTLFGTNFTNHTGATFNVNGRCGAANAATVNCYGISVQDGGVTTTAFTNNGTLSMPSSAFWYSSNATTQTVNNSGTMSVECFTMSGTTSSTTNSGTFEVTGTNGQCPNNGGNCTSNTPLCKDQGLFTGTASSILRVPNGTAQFVGGTTSSLCGKFYANNLTIASQSFSGACCLGIQVSNVLTVQSGNTYTAKLWFWDLTPTVYLGASNGDTYAGSTIGCDQTASAGKCWSGWRPTNVFYTSSNTSPDAACSNFSLPLLLQSFNGKLTELGNLLEWSGIYNDVSSIIINKSFDGINFSTIGKVKPKSTNSSSIEEFEYLDTTKNLNNKITYYLLETLSPEGVSSFSNIISLQNIHEENYSIVPMPVSGESFILYSNNSNFVYDIIDHTGRIVKSGIGTSTAEEIDINMLTNGHYILKIINIDNSKTINFIVNK